MGGEALEHPQESGEEAQGQNWPTELQIGSFENSTSSCRTENMTGGQLTSSPLHVSLGRWRVENWGWRFLPSAPAMLICWHSSVGAFLMRCTSPWHKGRWKPELDGLWWNGVVLVPVCPHCCVPALPRMQLVYLPFLLSVVTPSEQRDKKSAGLLMSLPPSLSAIGDLRMWLLLGTGAEVGDACLGVPRWVLLRRTASRAGVGTRSGGLLRELACSRSGAGVFQTLPKCFAGKNVEAGLPTSRCYNPFMMLMCPLSSCLEGDQAVPLLQGIWTSRSCFGDCSLRALLSGHRICAPAERLPLRTGRFTPKCNMYIET